MDVVLIVLLCGTGIYYTIRLKFVQVRKFKEGLRLVFGHMVSGDKTAGEGEMTPFQSVATAIAAQVGTGNLTGAATALLSGGPGAIFWMWLSAFFGMATIYAERCWLRVQDHRERRSYRRSGLLYPAAFRGTLERCWPDALPCLLLWPLDSAEIWYSQIPSEALF